MSSALLDLLVVGAGLRGLHRARAALARGERVRVVERLPYPGGSVRTQRSEGFTCELGAFALPAAELSLLVADLQRPPPIVSLQEQAHTGWIWNGALNPTPVDGDPRAGSSGMEDVVSAFRRELGDALWLGREVTSLRPAAPGWMADLGGDPGVTTTVAAPAVALCVPLDAAANLCAPLDPGLAGAAARLRRRPGAFVFLGTLQDQAAALLRGYGVLAETDGPVREVLFCSNALPRRAGPGKALVRIELGAADGDDEAAAVLAEAELRRMTGWSGKVLFRRVHRTSELVHDGAYAECSVRLADLARRAPGLLWSPAHD